MDALKQQAGRWAADRVEDGMTVGLGTGSTARFAIERLGERVRDEGLKLSGIPTSIASEELARAVGVPLVTFDQTDRLDLTIDGADEVDPGMRLIKGGGGALLREKVVARRSLKVCIVVDPGKVVLRLGAEGVRLPVEIVPFARNPLEVELRLLGAVPALRMRADKPFVTDNGNWILDLHFPMGIADPAGLESEIDRIPGVVESGLFVGLCHQLVIGRKEGPEVRNARPPG